MFFSCFSHRIILLSLMLLTASTGVLATSSVRPAFKPGEVLVTLKSVAMGVRLARELPGIAGIQRVSRNLHRIHLQPDESVASMLSRLQRHPLVLRAQPNYIKRLQFDPDNTQQWALGRISVEAAWETTKGTAGVVVAIIDTGIDGGLANTHPDLVRSLWRNSAEVDGEAGVDDDGNDYVDDISGFNFVDSAQPSSDLDDLNGHGTMVAGIVAAQQRDGTNISGVSPGVSLMIIKAFDDAGVGSTASVVASIDYAILMGADIINASYGHPGAAVYGASHFDVDEYDAIQRAAEANILVVLPAGNGGLTEALTGVGYDNDVSPQPYVPASYSLDNIIAVAATDHNDQLAGFSNWGVTSVDLAAPGVAIYSTSLGGYDSGDGTSYATPHVTAALALMLSVAGDHSVLALKKRLLAGVDPLEDLRSKVSSGGRLNVRAALAAEVNVETRSRQLSEGGGGSGDRIFLLLLAVGYGGFRRRLALV